MVDIFYPIQTIADFIVYSLLGLSKGPLAESLNFLIYDYAKILILLFLMISVAGFLRTYIPRHKIKEWLSGKRMGLGNLLASVFGAITPFCSCSSIPIFISFLEAGAPLGVNFSFLITSPLVNEYVAVIMLGFFGWEITLLYILSGILIGTFAGLILGKLRLEKYLEPDLISKKTVLDRQVKYGSLKERILFGINEGKSIVKRIWIWILIGLAVGAFIHGFVPENLIQGIIAGGGIFMVPIATLIGVPLYANCAAVIPIAVVLFEKGIPLGTALAFMMGTAALSLPEAIILRRVMKIKLIAIFFGIVALAIIFTGYLFNLLQGLLI